MVVVENFSAFRNELKKSIGSVRSMSFSKPLMMVEWLSEAIEIFYRAYIKRLEKGRV